MGEIYLLNNVATIEPKIDKILYRVGKKPNPDWLFPSPMVGEQYCRSFEGALKSVSFEYQDTANPAIGSFSLTDFVTGFNPSGYWGAPTQFINLTPSGGVPMRIVVSLTTSDKVTLHVMRSAGEVPAKFRNVRINGEPQDWTWLT